MKKLFATAICALLCIGVMAQANQPTISADVAANELVCIGNPVRYRVDFPQGLSGCSYSWRIKTGTTTFTNTNTTSQTFDATWSDQKPNKVEVEVVVSYRASNGSCSTPETTTLTFTHILRTVFQEDFFLTNPPSSIDFCSTGDIGVSVSPMYIPNTGTGSVVQTAVDSYEWVLPTGWRQVGSNNTGTINTTVNSITIQPVPGSCSTRGTVVVRAVANNISCPSLPVSKSRASNVVLNSPDLSASVTPQAGYFGGTACNTDPVTFTASLSHTLSCVQQYEWQFPAAWRWLNPATGQLTAGPVNTIGNSLVLYPDGSTNIVGNIRAGVRMTCGSVVNSSNFALTYIEPVLSGPSLVCSSANYTIQNTSVGSVNWASSDTGILTINSSTGAATRVGSNSGYVTLSATLPCAAPVQSKLVWVGEPSITYFPPGSNPCYNNPYYQGPNVPGLYYTWSVDNSNVRFTSSANAFSTAVISNNPEYFTIALEVTDGNCTASNSQFSYTDGYYCQCFFDPLCGGLGFSSFSVSPNPTVDDQLVIELDENEFENKSKLKGEVAYSISVIKSDGNEILKLTTKSQKQIIDTSKLQEGVYFLKITYNNKMQTQRILVSHKR